MDIKNKKAFIKNYIKNTHTEKDFEDLENFNTKEINQIYNEIINYNK